MVSTHPLFENENENGLHIRGGTIPFYVSTFCVIVIKGEKDSLRRGSVDVSVPLFWFLSQTPSAQ